KLVTSFAAHPELIIVFIEECHHSLVLTPGVLDMYLAAHFSSTPERFAHVTGKKSMSPQTVVVVASHHRVERDDPGGHKLRSRFNHVAGGRLDASDDVFDGSQRSEPVRRVSEVRSSYSRKKVFCATSEARNFVWHGGAN